ncbi:MAG: aldo/keto reductase [Anaerolineae bacterium]|nr:aldo/keto reductase [Anaerolineae bacterium]
MINANSTKPAGAAGTVQLGDIAVNRMGFGAMRITGSGIWGEPDDREAAKAVLHKALDLGVNFIDTADAYGPDVSELLIAEALYPYPDDLVIGTKGGLLRDGPGQWRPDGRPEHLRQALNGSLQRLKLEQIDLYQFHRPDPAVPFEESIGALADLRAEGKIRHLGLSNVTVAQLEQARQIVPIVSVQNRYNLTDRASEDVLEACDQAGIAFIPWYPLATGNLATEGSPLTKAARQHNAAPAQLALAWLLKRSPIMLVIPGTSSAKHLAENVKAAQIALRDDEFEAIAGSSV